MFSCQWLEDLVVCRICRTPLSREKNKELENLKERTIDYSLFSLYSIIYVCILQVYCLIDYIIILLLCIGALYTLR